MKVLFVCSGNAESFDIVPFIKEQGESLKRLGIQIEYFPIIGKGLIGYLKAGFRLRKYLKYNKFDIIHAHFTKSGLTAVIGTRKIPIVISLMGSDAYGEYIGHNKVIFISRYMTLLTYLIQPFVKAIISKSKNIDNYVYMKRKSYIIPNGINLEKFMPHNVDSIIPSTADTKTKRILYLGNIRNKRKNFKLVEEAVLRLNRRDVELINPYPIPHDDIPKYLNHADVFVMSSFMEGSPNVIKEAMACNCPIVATDVGDVKWVLGNIEGCYISSFKVEEYASKLREALKFSEERRRTKGNQRIKELGLDSEIIAKRIIQIYTSLIK